MSQPQGCSLQTAVLNQRFKRSWKMNDKTWSRTALSPRMVHICTKSDLTTLPEWFMHISFNKMGSYHWTCFYSVTVIVLVLSLDTVSISYVYLVIGTFLPNIKGSHHFLVVWWNSQSNYVDLLPKSFQTDETWLWSSTCKEQMKKYRVRYHWTSLGSNLNPSKIIKDKLVAIRWEISSFEHLAFSCNSRLCSFIEERKWGEQHTVSMSQVAIPQTVAVNPSPTSHLLL